MTSTASLPPELFWQQDSFRFIKAEEFEQLGIDPADIPLGTFPAMKHPSHLPSKFGGNAYGFGLFEVYDRLKPHDIKLIQSITLDNPEDIKKHYRSLNEIYAQLGLLIRFSNQGKPYYLIPVHLASDTLTHIKSKVDEITKIVDFHSKKYLKEYHAIGLLSDPDDLISRELSFRFKEHNFVAIDSLEKLQNLNQPLDLIILSRDLFEIILLKKFSPLSQEIFPKRRLEQYVVYMLWKLYHVLKPDGEVFIISNVYAPKTNKTVEITFKTLEEEKRFSLFTHIFRTKKKYRPCGEPLQVNIFDFQKYLSGLYVEEEVINGLLSGRSLKNMTLEETNNLPHLDFPLDDLWLLCEQEKNWPRLLTIFLDTIFFKPLVPPSVSDDWDKRFYAADYTPGYMIIYLGQKKSLKTTLSELMQDAEGSGLLGCPQNLLADYRDQFDYVINTLHVLERLKKGTYEGLPEITIDRLRQPLVNKNRRFANLNDVIKLMKDIKRLEKVKGYMNPDNIEGPKTRVLENIEALTFFGFTYNELREIIYIVFGHTPFGRIISGKMSEKAFKPVLELALSFDIQQAINLLRYCRLMTMAETGASSGLDVNQEQLAELFDFYESAVKVVANRDLEWDEILDERIASMGGIHNKVIRKILKMMNFYEFINDWAELGQKGLMEKESIADYDPRKLERIENVIRLIKAIDRFEQYFQKSDQLELPAFYRRILDKEFHGTGYLFERMDGELVYALLAVTANLSDVKIINFNPLLAGVKAIEFDERIKRIEQEARAINIRYVDFDVLSQFSNQLHRHGASFVLGTGFQLKIDSTTQILEVFYLDVDQNLKDLESMATQISGRPISDISTADLKKIERIFSNVESFYQSHISFLKETHTEIKLPSQQIRWFQKAKKLRHKLRSHLLFVFFRPQDIYANLDRLYLVAPCVLDFILPEFTGLQDRVVSWHLYMTSPVTHYILAATRKLQALITRKQEDFQDIHFLHRLAQREFGPLATGTVGVSTQQISDLEDIVEKISKNKPLFDALIKSLIFQDLGRLPALREKYKQYINPAELAQASAVFIEKKGIAQAYRLGDAERSYLIFLVRHHSMMHHILRGEFSSLALTDILNSNDRELFDAFFVFSFIMLSAIRDDLIREDLADQLFMTKKVVDQIFNGETTLEKKLDRVYLSRGRLFCALESYRKRGLPEGLNPASYLSSQSWREPERSVCLKIGSQVSALERIFKLRGIRYIKYIDLVKLMIKIPLKFIYKERRLTSIGYSTFEKELFEAFRIYNSVRMLPENVRFFILNQLSGDKVRIFGYEKVSGYLNYKNQIKLLLVALLGTAKFGPKDAPVCLNFLGLCEKIEKRYEAVNDCLNRLYYEDLLDDHPKAEQFFTAESGLTLRLENFTGVCSIDFLDDINISQKISYINSTQDLEQLKSYYHISLRSIKNHPFYTDDYAEKLTAAFERRQTEITDMLVTQTKTQMDRIHDFKELHNLVKDLLDRSGDIGFSDDQKHRLNDLFDLRKDSLKKEKSAEIDKVLGEIRDLRELQDYWDSIKGYLQANRRFFGKEFETTTAKKFDAVSKEIRK
jgi:hypothetical protein